MSAGKRSNAGRVAYSLVSSILFVASAATQPEAAGASPVESLQEAEALCRADDGRLWGTSLCGPLLLVDPATRDVFANQADKQKILRPEGGIFAGKLPNEINIANTAVEWGGVKWTMIMLPLPEEKARRAALMAHEMWHRIQEEIGFPASGAANHHLDAREGRFWLQLEWRALAAALGTRGEERKQAVTDAALFRARRHQLFKNAAEEERAMELHEGLAEYTGVKLSGHDDLQRFVTEGRLKDAPTNKTFVRSFAYATGPAYGLLLDDLDSDWRGKLKKEDDLAQLVFARAAITLPADLQTFADERSRGYGGMELAAAEERREHSNRELIESYRARLVDGAVVTIPLQKMNMQFNPGNLVTLEPLGTVYPDIRIVDVWGVLTVARGGALMSSDFSRITVPAPTKTGGTKIDGDGWQLELKPGWSVAPADRQGSFVLRSAD